MQYVRFKSALRCRNHVIFIDWGKGTKSFGNLVVFARKFNYFSQTMTVWLQKLDFGGAGDGDLHADAFGDGDDHGTVAVDAFDDAFNAQEGT